jgi:hypothetical protein
MADRPAPRPSAGRTCRFPTTAHRLDRMEGRPPNSPHSLQTNRSIAAPLWSTDNATLAALWRPPCRHRSMIRKIPSVTSRPKLAIEAAIP